MTELKQVKVGCPDEAALAAYLGGSMTAWERERVEEHAAGCVLCLENIRAGYLGEKMFTEGSLPAPKKGLTDKAKGIANMNTGKKKIITNLWLAATVAAFLLSFTVPKYFAQFLVAALILGLKWVSESEGIRTLIVSMDAKRRHESQKEDLSKWRR